MKRIIIAVAVAIAFGVLWNAVPSYRCAICGEPVWGDGYVANVNGNWERVCEHHWNTFIGDYPNEMGKYVRS